MVASQLTVTIAVPEGAPRQLRVPGPEAVLGRSRAAQVRLVSDAVSGAHARVRIADGALEVEDLGSANGTWLHGERLPAGRPQPLPEDAELRVGPYRVRVSTREAPGLGEDTDALAARLVQDLMASGGAPPATLQIRQPDGTSATAVLPPTAPLCLGRDPGCELCVADPDVSRRHAVFRLAGAGATVEDLGSKNGVRRGADRLEGETPLAHGDRLRIGGTEVRFVDPATAWLEDLAEDPPAAVAPAPVPRPVDPLAAEPRPGRSRAQLAPGGVGRAVVVVVALLVMAAAGWALVQLLR